MPALLTETTYTLADFVSHVTTIIGDSTSGVVKWIGQFVGVITANPIIELFVLLSVVGLGVGLLRRLISVN